MLPVYLFIYLFSFFSNVMKKTVQTQRYDGVQRAVVVLLNEILVHLFSGP